MTLNIARSDSESCSSTRRSSLCGGDAAQEDPLVEAIKQVAAQINIKQVAADINVRFVYKFYIFKQDPQRDCRKFNIKVHLTVTIDRL